MNALMPRLILGTGRLAGGLGMRESMDIVCSALDAGIAAVDTAPSYGMGTAELVVGRALQRFSGIHVTTKLGSIRPSLPGLQTVARWAKRRLGLARGLAAGALPPERLEHPTGNDFSERALRASLAISCDRLGRIDALLVHDVSPGEVTPDLLALLQSLCAEAKAAPGYASRARWDVGFDTLFPAEYLGQFAVVPGWIGEAVVPQRSGSRLHGIVTTGLALWRDLPGFSDRLDHAARACPQVDRLTARIAALFAIFGERLPGSSLLIASSRRERMVKLLAAIAALDRAGAAEEVAWRFAAYKG